MRGFGYYILLLYIYLSKLDHGWGDVATVWFIVYVQSAIAALLVIISEDISLISIRLTKIRLSHWERLKERKKRKENRRRIVLFYFNFYFVSHLKDGKARSLQSYQIFGDAFFSRKRGLLMTQWRDGEKCTENQIPRRKQRGFIISRCQQMIPTRIHREMYPRSVTMFIGPNHSMFGEKAPGKNEMTIIIINDTGIETLI